MGAGRRRRAGSWPCREPGSARTGPRRGTGRARAGAKPPPRSPATAARAATEVREAAPVEVEAVGFGIPCLIDQRSGTAVMAVNLPIVDFPLRDVMAERLGLPVFVDNDANVAALAEHRWGAAKGTSYSVTLTLGTGIGGGMVLDGRLYHGFAGAG